jgi:hypothetical protein
MEHLTLTRGEALDMIADAANGDRPFDALSALAHLWIGHNEHGFTLSDDYAEFLRDYVQECCNSMADDERSNGPKDSDDTGISA